MNYDWRVSDVCLRVMYNEIHKYMNLVFGDSGTLQPSSYGRLFTNVADFAQRHELLSISTPNGNCKIFKPRIWFKFCLLINTLSFGTETEKNCMLVSSNFIRASLLSHVTVSDISESISVTAYRQLSNSDK